MDVKMKSIADFMKEQEIEPNNSASKNKLIAAGVKRNWELRRKRNNGISSNFSSTQNK
jgi:hypothetical protein